MRRGAPWGTAAVAWLGVATSGCAQIQSTSRVEVIPRTVAAPPRIGSGHGHVTARGADIGWSQRGATLEVTLVETRRCRELHHEPVTRVEHVDRKPPQALYWEYGIAAAFLAVGLTGLIAPELFSPTITNADGEQVDDTRTGYRIGGVFTGIGAVALTAGVVDTVRSRDVTYSADAYRVTLGEQVECAAPRSALAKTEVEVIIGQWSTRGTTNGDGMVSFTLPSELDQAPPPPSKVDRLPGSVTPPPPPANRNQGVIRVDDARRTSFDFFVPYASAEAAAHQGRELITADDLAGAPPPRTSSP